jgi:hypothetical protein
MKAKLPLLLSFTVIVFTCKSAAQLSLIEPDDYAAGTVLDHLFPPLTLVTADANNSPMPFFPVTAVTENFPGYAPTGTKVFGNAGINFWNHNWRLRLDFAQPANFLSLEFGGGNFAQGETARLDAFNQSGQLLASYVSQPRLGGSFETLSISRPAGDIAWAVAYLPPDGGSFGRFDRLQFSVVPEPASSSLLVLSAGAWTLRRGRNRGPRAAR